MKNHARLPLLVTAAVFALTACTPVADFTPAAEPTTTPEITAEPASKPAAAETGPTLYLQPPLCAGCCL